MKKKISNNKLVITLFIINTSIFIISFSIFFVLLFRPFYYLNIKLLNIEKETGYTYQEIKEAYDDVIDYSIFKKPFKTGKLKYSSEGKNHFKDCRKLFLLDFILLGISTIILIIRKKYLNIKCKNYSIEYWSSILIIIIFLTLLLISFIIGFDRCFEIFHKLFFYGKENWRLDPDTDEIILILPKQYFMNCAIFILSIIGFLSFGRILKERLKREG